ncbi:uncharacterized protein LOC124362566 [Homalodisca vitripennis]|uniref:uncharacterized protein LOC124362566 n=1 Tax=Homalodisca vitripennis TaxID=197043 RepID=UPI001EEA2354|nr:uncharacterized protein LOC124362566 [Homalodisca vitripennis]
MMYAGRQITLATLVLVVVTVHVSALPNHLKAVVIDTEPDLVPVKKATVVSASFGGYSAKAGLGGSGSTGGLFAAADSPHGSASAGLGGSGTTGGLFANADSPHGSASAGLGGSVASSSATGGLGAAATTGDVDVHHKPTGGHKPVQYGPGLFDNIFNIPISVLQAVNTYLNNRGPVTKPIHRRRGHQPRHPVVYKTV